MVFMVLLTVVVVVLAHVCTLPQPPVLPVVRAGERMQLDERGGGKRARPAPQGRTSDIQSRYEAGVIGGLVAVEPPSAEGAAGGVAAAGERAFDNAQGLSRGVERRIAYEREHQHQDLVRLRQAQSGLQ